MVDSTNNVVIPQAKNVTMIDEAKAEELKKLGNEEFQKKNYQKAIEYYSEAIGNLLSLYFVLIWL